MSKIRVSEIFASMQGEGRFTGKPSLWIRFFGCNLSCQGFGQKDPTAPSTYVLPHETIDLSNIKQMSELPVFDKGCDSSYSWSHRFKHLAPFMTIDEIVDKLIDLGQEELGVNIIDDRWIHPVTHVASQLCFTGGEPMLQQRAITKLCEHLVDINAAPPMITIETNATQRLDEVHAVRLLTQHLHFSCSPKLYSTSGEKDAVKPEVINEYVDLADSGILKFVVDGTQRTWDELDQVMQHLSPIIQGTTWDTWVMPVNSTIETQSPEHISNIAREALRRGFALSVRAHVHAFGNVMGS